MDEEFPNVFIDERAAENALWKKTNDEIDRLIRDREKGIKLVREVAQLASKATLPAEAEARVSVSIGGAVTITVTNLTSFHDITELTGVLWNEYKREYATAPNHYDYPESKTRSVSICNWNRGIHIDVKAILDEERGECKIITTGVQQPYVPEATLKQEIICPGDPRYDDF
jgi:hypothetical protein